MAADDDADDKPLSQLCNSAAKKKLDKGAKTNDDTPLSALVAKNTSSKQAVAKAKSTPGPPAAPAGKPGVPGVPGAKQRGRPPGAAGKAKAKAKSSSSSSSSSSDSSSSDSRAARKKKLQRTALLKRKQQQAEEGGAEDNFGGAVKKKERSPKEELVAQLLSRWWYSKEYKDRDWPPQEEEYYQEQLAQQKLRKVTIQEWEWVPEEDEAGRRKVYELSQFRGVFRSSAGELVDLRPKETCPCYNNFIKKDMVDLCNMLISAYENQLADLKDSKYPEEKTKSDIQTELTKLRNKLHQAKLVNKK